MSAEGCPLGSPQYRLPQRAIASVGSRHWGYLIPVPHQPKADPYHEADVTLRLRCELPWMSAEGCPLGSPQYRLPQRATASAGNRHWGYLIPPLHQPKADPYHEAGISLWLRCDVAWMGSPSATRREAVTIRGCHLLQSLRSFGKWYPRLPRGQPKADINGTSRHLSRRLPSG